MRSFLLCAAAVALAGCGKNADSVLEGLDTRTVTLPNGAQIQAEVKIKPADMQQGMMFRETLPAGKGMLFIHNQAGPYTYWMYNVRIPLDIIWMDANRRIVEISANTPPCKSKASDCPSYGGRYPSLYVLELGGGEAARYGLKPGDTLTF